MVVFAVCAAGIAGMVAGSIADDNAVALTFGLITAAAVACLIVATAVAGPARAADDEEAIGAEVESQASALVAEGADEAAVRRLVTDAVRLGRAHQGSEEKAGAGVHGGRTPRPDEQTFP